jgi:chromosome segregation ATPase
MRHALAEQAARAKEDRVEAEAALRSEAEEASRKMLADFEDAHSFLKGQIEAQARQLREAEVRYINREARDIDVQKIAQLQASIQQLQGELQQSMAELKHCRLELNNRDVNYSKLFGKSPLLSVATSPALGAGKAASNAFGVATASSRKQIGSARPRMA